MSCGPYFCLPVDLVEFSEVTIGGCSSNSNSNIINKSRCNGLFLGIGASVNSIRDIEQVKDGRERLALWNTNVH